MNQKNRKRSLVPVKGFLQSLLEFEKQAPVLQFYVFRIINSSLLYRHRVIPFSDVMLHVPQ